MSAADAVVITGADGFLGLALAERYLSETRARLVLWVRARERAELVAKQQRLRTRLGRFEERWSCAGGDLAAGDPFDGVDPREVRVIVHTAAVTRFDADRTTAEAINVLGTSKVLEFASRCSSLESIGLTSSVYASGLRRGVLLEEPWTDEHGFANHYEWSKWAAERALFDRYAELPYRLFRIATAIADDDSGAVSQLNVMHKVLRLLFTGLLPIVPGDPETPLYTVTREFVVDAVFRLMSRSPARSIYHVCHAQEASKTLGEWVDLAHAAFSARPEYASRRVLRPLFADGETYARLSHSAELFSSGALRQAMVTTAPFAKQMFVGKDVRNDALVAALGRPPHADLAGLTSRICRFLAERDWQPVDGESACIPNPEVR